MIRSRLRNRGGYGAGNSGPTDAYFSNNAKTDQYFTDNAKTIPYDTTGSGKLPGDTVIALFGDSLEQHMGTGAINAGSEEFSNWSRGYYNWARMLDPRGRWNNWYDASRASKFFIGQNVGISGNQTNQMIARITDLTNISGLKLAIIGGGTNDLNSARSNALILADLNSIYTAVKAVGAKIIIVTPPPRSLTGTDSWASGSAIRLAWMSLCTSMQAIADADPTNIKIVRRDKICSLDDADMTPIAGYLNSDNVHLAPLGGHAVAVGRTGWPGLIDKIAEWVDSFTLFPDAAQTGDIATNPTLTGTGGTVGTGTTGTVADNMRVQRASVTGGGAGVTCVASKETVDGIAYQKLVFTRDGAGGTATFNLDRVANILIPGSTSAQVGRWYRGFMQFKSTASSAFQGIYLRARGQPSTPANMDTNSMKVDTGLPWPNVALQKADGSPLWTVCPPMCLRAGTTSILWAAVIVLDNTTAGTETVWISRMQLVPVAQPSRALGYA